MAASKEPVDFTLDLSDQSVKREPNKFDHLCDSVLSCFVTHGNTLTEFYRLKDELLQHSLPTSLLLQLTLTASRIYRSHSDLCVPLREMTRMVKLYSVPWEEKPALLKKLKADYESKQKQLNIALRHLQAVSLEEEKMEHERRLNNWMKLYSRVMATRSHGRRWKFRIAPFKKKLREGYNPFGSDSSDGEEDEDHTPPQPSYSGSEDEEELRALSSIDERSNRDISQELASRLSGSMMKRVRFGDLESAFQPPASPEVATPPEPHPTVETAEAGSWTGEPDYTTYLLVLLYRPKRVLQGQDVCCTLSIEGQYITSEVFKGQEADENSYQSFHFELSSEAVKCLTSVSTADDVDTDLASPKLLVAVYPRSIAEQMAAHSSIPLSHLMYSDDPTIIVPPDTREEEFSVDWESVTTQQEDEHDQPPEEFELKLTVKETEVVKEEEEEDDEDEVNKISATVPLICHLVKVQRVVEEDGYKKMCSTVSAATSAIALPQRVETPPPPTPEPKIEEEDDKMTAEEVAALTFSHTEEMKKLQQEYEKKLELLSRSLTKLKSEKDKQIQALEEALTESEASKGRRVKSSSDIRSLLAKRQRRKVTHGLPNWGKDLPDDFFKRLELFAMESVQKHRELTERIKTEVKEACEKQLALQHKLAPTVSTNVTAAMEDVCLPALFMPTTPSSPSRALVYNPRAHNYFHPAGSPGARVTQPPAIFKLPAVQTNQLSTLNLYGLTKSNTAQTGPSWLRTDQSPSYTPAPPPSACDFYHTQRLNSASRSQQHSPAPHMGKNKQL